jgi:hypothetical protein
MSNRRATVLRLGSPADLISTVSPLLGFVPSESLVVVCLHAPRGRVGLVMRFELADVAQIDPFVAMLHERVNFEHADAVFVAIYTAEPTGDGDLPRAALVNAMVGRIDEVMPNAVLVSADRWWSYFDHDVIGTPLDAATPGATSVAAAYALAGQGVLPDREAVIRSVALALGETEAIDMRARIASFEAQYATTGRTTRQDVVAVLARRLANQLVDPRGVISADDAAEFAALCDDVVVRDQVLVTAIGTDAREFLLPLLREMVRRVPPPHDAPACSMLAWVSYAHGDGVIANVMVERALATNPDYAFAKLIADALYRQVPPRLLEEVMRGAARDLRHRSAAG